MRPNVRRKYEPSKYATKWVGVGRIVHAWVCSDGLTICLAHAAGLYVGLGRGRQVMMIIAGLSAGLIGYRGMGWRDAERRKWGASIEGSSSREQRRARERRCEPIRWRREAWRRRRHVRIEIRRRWGCHARACRVAACGACAVTLTEEGLSESEELPVELLLLKTGPIAAGSGCAHPEWVLAVREPNATTFDEPVEVVAVELIQGLGRVLHVFELQNM